MFLYLLENSLSKKYYIGTTIDKERRLIEHNSPSKHYTGKAHGEWKIVGSKYFSDTAEARKEEIRLKKSKNRKYILWYFTNKNRAGSSVGRAVPS